MQDTRAAFLAGLMMGRGGFGTDDGGPWVYFTTLDHEIAVEAMGTWGGHIIERTNGAGMREYKYAARKEEALAVLRSMYPHLRGSKRERASDLLAGWYGAQTA